MNYIRIYESKKGGWVDVHPLHGADELPNNAEASMILADHGYQIQLLPLIPASATEKRQIWLPDVFGSKNPDVRINGELIGDIKTPDIRSPIRKSIISRCIYDAAKQKVPIAIINLRDKDYSFQDVKKGIVGALQPDRNKSILFVWIITRHRNLFVVDRKHVFNDMIYEVLTRL
jgi:hypothetical protein